MQRKPFQRPDPLDIHEDRPASIAQSDVPSNPDPREVAATREAAAAFDKDWEERQDIIRNSPILAFLKAHELAGSPNELTICGYSGIKIMLGDLRALMRILE